MTRISFSRLAWVWLLLAVMAVMAAPASAQQLKLSSSSINFVTPVGTSPQPETFFAYSETAVPGFNPTVLASTESGSWLSVTTAAGGSFPSSINVRVSVNSNSLAVGTYRGEVTVTQSGLSGSPARLPVTLQVVPSAPFLLPEPSSLAVGARTGLDPAPLSLSVRNAGTGSISPTFAATTNSGGSWLALSAPIAGSFANTTSVSVLLRTASLAAGTYTGNVTITSAGATNSPVNVPVTVTVGATGSAVLSVAPASINFVAGLGLNPTARTININNTGTGSIRPTATAATTTGGRWLSVSAPFGGSFGGAISSQVYVDITGLPKGTYNGTVTISDASASNSPLQIPVTLTLDDPRPRLRLNTAGFGFPLPIDQPLAQHFLEIINEGTGAMRWNATARSEGPRPWLVITPTSGSAPEAVNQTPYSVVRLFVDATGLARGVYRGSITVTAETAGTEPSTITIPVTLAYGVALPAVNNGGIVNAASFTQAAISAGSIVSLFGTNMGPGAGVAATLVGGKLPTELSGVRVFFDDFPAPLFYASDRQINAQVPNEVAGRASVLVKVTYNGVDSVPLRINTRAADPGIFLVNGRPAIVRSSTNELLSDTVRAVPGEFLTIYTTGLGAVDTAVETGAPAPATSLVRTRVVPRVIIGGFEATVQFAGLAPGFVGLYQVNVQVPANVPSGNTTLVLSVDSAAAAPATVPVR